MEKIKICLTFDDGRIDNYRVFKSLLLPLKVPASIYITTGYIENKCSLGKNQRTSPMTWDQIKELNTYKIFEIASHSNMHCNDFKDIITGNEILFKQLKKSNDDSIGFASPGSMMSKKFVSENKEIIGNMGLSYIRSGSNFQVQSRKNSEIIQFIHRVARKLLRFINCPLIYYWAYNDSYVSGTQNDDVKLYTSFPVFHDTKVNSLKMIVTKAMKNGENAIFMFHSIKYKGEDGYTDTWSWDYNSLEQFVRYLMKLSEDNRIEIVTVESLSK